MKTRAKLSSLRIAPRKVRLVADVIRGLDVKIAQDQLSVMNRRSAKPMLKLLNSAIANAENNSKLKQDNLFIEEIRIDGGSILKRWMPRAQGRATRINKRTSHISIVLEERVKTEVKEDKKDKKEDKKDVKIVKSLDEVKEMEKEEKLKIEDEKKPDAEGNLAEIKDVRREGSDRNQQHLDTVRKSEKGGGIKKMFRRKSI
jgi:large subunit ribosomal protein L22